MFLTQITFLSGIWINIKLASTNSLFNLYAEYIMRNTGLEEAEAGIKIVRRNIISDMQMTPRLWQKVKKN